MDPDRIEALLKLMHQYQVAELALESKGERVTLKIAGALPAVSIPAVAPAVEGTVSASPAPAARAPAPAAPASAAHAEGALVKSPMVGTFYRSPKPGQPPFIGSGDRVKKGQILCIIEAMKLMNELESELDGVVAEILVEDARPVQFGQPLFRIVPG